MAAVYRCRVCLLAMVGVCTAYLCYSVRRTFHHCSVLWLLQALQRRNFFTRVSWGLDVTIAISGVSVNEPDA